jgi:hypothetical protein
MPQEFNKTEEDILSQINDAPATRVNEPADGSGQQQQDEGNNNEEDNTGAGDEGAAAGEGAGEEDKKSGDDKAGKAGGAKPEKGAKPAKELTPAQKQEGYALRQAQGEIARLKQGSTAIAQQLTTTKAELDGMKQTFAQINSHNLQPNELAEGARIIANYKKDPVACIEEILTLTKAAGIDLSRLSLNTIDTTAIMNMIEQKIGGRLDPLTQEREEAKLNEADKNAAIQELNNFLAIQPEAESHLTAITKLMEANPGLTLDGAWDKVQAWAYRNGIDIFTPPDNTSTSGQTRDNQVRKPLPNGGGRQIANNGANNGAASAKPQVAAVGTTLDDIITASMQEAGLNYRR